MKFSIPVMKSVGDHRETGHLLDSFASEFFPSQKLAIILEKGCVQVHNFCAPIPIQSSSAKEGITVMQCLFHTLYYVVSSTVLRST